MKKNKTIIGLISVLFLSVFFVVPVLITVSNSNWHTMVQIIKSPFYSKILRFSLFQAFISAFCSVLIALPGVWIICTTDFRFKSVVKAIYHIPFVLPTILGVLGFVILYGNNGILSNLLTTKLNILYSFKAVLLAHVFYNFPLVVSIVSNHIEKLDPSIEDQGRLSGASEMQVFTKLTVPRILPCILSAFCIVFLLCFSSFAIILVLGGGPQLTTVEVEIYTLAKISLDFSKASCLSLYSLFICFVFLLLQNHFEKASSYSEFSNSKHQIKTKNSKLLKTVSTIYLVISCLFILCPVLCIAYRSLFSPVSRTGQLLFSLKNYKNLSVKCFAQTFAIALCSALISTLISYGFCTNKHGLLAMLPLAISSVITGLSLYVVSLYLKFIPPLILIIIAHSIINLPVAYKTINPIYLNMPKEYKEIALIEGSTKSYFNKKVVFPFLRNSIISSVLICFCMSIGELNASLILGSPTVETIPMQIHHMIASYNFQGACAYGSVLCLLCFIFLAFAQKLKQFTDQ